MNVAARQRFAGLVRDLAGVLQSSGDRRSFVLLRESRSMPSVYAPRFEEHARAEEKDTDARTMDVPNPASTDAAKPVSRITGPMAASLPANVRCTHCTDRIYGVRRYLQEGRLPVLVLHYNYPLDEKGTAHPDRSARGIFATQEEDELFARMLLAAGLQVSDLSFQEFPACHFDPRSLPEDWNRRTSNCLEHVQNTVQERQIRQIIVTGAAAVLLFGDQAQVLADRAESIPFELIQPAVPCLVLRSPAALLAMERQRLVMERSLERYPDELQTYTSLRSKPVEFREWAVAALASLPPEVEAEQGIKMVGSVRLKSAAAITGKAKGKGDREFERFRSAAREGAGILFRLQRLRENEAQVKRQILESLKKVKVGTASEEGTTV